PSKRCPICKKICIVATSGKKGYCKTMRKHWEKRVVSPSEIGPGRIQHPELPTLLLDIIRWTYKVVGHYVQPTLEQWELGFMKDMHVAREVSFWHRLAFAFLTYHRRRGLSLRGDDEERPLVALFCDPSIHGEGTSKTPERELVKECLVSPDG